MQKRFDDRGRFVISSMVACVEDGLRGVRFSSLPVSEDKTRVIRLGAHTCIELCHHWRGLRTCAAGTCAVKGKIGPGRTFSLFNSCLPYFILFNSCLPYFIPDLIMRVPFWFLYVRVAPGHGGVFESQLVDKHRLPTAAYISTSGTVKPIQPRVHQQLSH
jgi:hypothetical protein